jgi:adenine phosphoribosyltransferase
VISEKYALEYGKDCLEMHVGALEAHEQVLIVDDVIATGGTLSAAIRLIGMYVRDERSYCSDGGFIK